MNERVLAGDAAIIPRLTKMKPEPDLIKVQPMAQSQKSAVPTPPPQTPPQPIQPKNPK